MSTPVWLMTTWRSPPACSGRAAPPTRVVTATSGTPSTSRRACSPPHPDRGGRQRPKVTWRLAARFADELCLDALMPDAVAKALSVSGAAVRRSAVTRPACGSRSTSGASRRPCPWNGAPRPARGYADLGVDRVVVQGSRPSNLPTTWTRGDGGLRRRRAAGTGLSRRHPFDLRVVALGQRRSTVQVNVRVMPSTAWMRKTTSLPS
jgi:hypothetical protein